jgi:hypothetical protein
VLKKYSGSCQSTACLQTVNTGSVVKDVAIITSASSKEMAVAGFESVNGFLRPVVFFKGLDGSTGPLAFPSASRVDLDSAASNPSWSSGSAYFVRSHNQEVVAGGYITVGTQNYAVLYRYEGGSQPWRQVYLSPTPGTSLMDGVVFQTSREPNGPCYPHFLYAEAPITAAGLLNQGPDSKVKVGVLQLSTSSNDCGSTAAGAQAN